MTLKDDPAHAANHLAALRKAERAKPPTTSEKDSKMFAGSTIGGTDDYDRVLKILDLISDVGKAKDAVHRTRQLAVEYERLAAGQTELKAHAAKVAELDKQLTERAADLAARESAMNAKEDRLLSREIDLERRLNLLKSAAA